MNKYPLSSVAKVIRGVTFSKSEGTNTPSDKRLPVIRAGSIQQSLLLDEGQIWIPANKIKPNQMIRKNDIVMCTSSGSSDLVGKCAKSTQDWNGSFGAFCAGIRANESKCSSSYLYHFLCSPHFRNWTKSSSGANIKNIRASELAAFEIPLPPLEEQKRIAAILDKADAIRRKRQQAIDLTDQLLRSVFLDMFGDPVLNNNNWERVSLDSVCRKITDGTHHSPEPQNKGVPYITAKHLKPNRLDFYSKPTYVSQEAHKEIYSRCNPEINDVLYIKDGATTGAAATNPYDFEFSMLSSLALIKVDTNKLLPEYLCDWLNFESVKENILKNMSGAAITRLTIRKIKDVILELPPLNLQKEYLDIRERIMGKTKKLSASLVEADKLFNSLSQQAFRGELGSKTKAA